MHMFICMFLCIQKINKAQTSEDTPQNHNEHLHGFVIKIVLYYISYIFSLCVYISCMIYSISKYACTYDYACVCVYIYISGVCPAFSSYKSGHIIIYVKFS